MAFAHDGLAAESEPVPRQPAELPYGPLREGGAPGASAASAAPPGSPFLDRVIEMMRSRSSGSSGSDTGAALARHKEDMRRARGEREGQFWHPGDGRGAAERMVSELRAVWSGRHALQESHLREETAMLRSLEDPAKSGGDEGFLYNMIVNPGHKPGQPNIGAAGVGGQGKRDQALGSLALAATAVFGPSALRVAASPVSRVLRFGRAARPTSVMSGAKALFARVSAVGALAQQIEPGQDASALAAAFRGDATEEQYHRAKAYLEQSVRRGWAPSEGEASEVARDAKFDLGTGLSGAGVGNAPSAAGTLADLLGAVSSLRSKASALSLAGEDPYAPSTAVRVVAGASSELAASLAGRYADKIPYLNRVVPEGGLNDALVAGAGGVAQSYLGRRLGQLTPEQTDRALSTLQVLYPEYGKPREQ